MSSSHHYETVERAISYISQHFRDQPGLDEIARSVNLSPYHFQRVFREWAGISPRDFLQFLTAQQAKKSLKEGLSTLETAYESGLSGNGRLHDLFIKIEACTPGQFKNRGRNTRMLYSFHESHFGIVLIVETPRGINRISFTEDREAALNELKSDYPEAHPKAGTGEFGKMAADYLREWKTPENRIVLSLKGTPFQIKVWNALLRIPPGILASYSTVAAMIDSPEATRAVGSALGRNPVACLIPCHRVIRQNGDFGEYHWGSTRKKALIAYEQVNR